MALPVMMQIRAPVTSKTPRPDGREFDWKTVMESQITCGNGTIAKYPIDPSPLQHSSPTLVPLNLTAQEHTKAIFIAVSVPLTP